MDDLGELSQDDIDSLLNSNATDQDDPIDADDLDDDMELISQDDIDSLMNDSADPDVDLEDIEEDDIGELSQDDIDSLMNPSSDEDPTNDEVDDDDIGELSQNDIDGLLAESRALDIDLSFWDITTKYTTDSPCPWPFERAFISSDKKVVPCCMIGNPDIYSFGTLGDFNEIWNSGQYEEFRRAHLSGNIPQVCKYCYEGEGE